MLHLLTSQVAAGQIGVDPVKVEKFLKNVFKIASRWKAILLLDEADVFLAERTNDPNLNALVSVFLRELEHYEGILFLNTNRVKSFDEAILGRIHLALKYKPLGLDARYAIWQHFLGLAKTTKGLPGLCEAVVRQLAGKGLNGREVRCTLLMQRYLLTMDADTKYNSRRTVDGRV